MSFVETFNSLPFVELNRLSQSAAPADVAATLANPSRKSLADFAVLVSPAAGKPEFLEEMARRSHALTLKHFGRSIRLFAPLYLSNECINNCKYCGFSRDNPILRVTLTLDQVDVEAKYLHDQGFRHILLVAGEHPHFVSNTYLKDCIRRLHLNWPSISLEVGPLDTEAYVPIVESGAEGLVIYQETYNREVYKAMHVSGPKMDFEYRLETPERAYRAGFKRIGIAALLGLTAWRNEALALAAHAYYLLKHCWKSQITVSVPRLRPAAGEFEPLTHVTDLEMVQFICALRIAFPELGLVLSTRESSSLRNGLIPLGITMISAGSHTEPGGYTGQGRGSLHITKGGRLLNVSNGDRATVQFEIGDQRSANEVASYVKKIGYESVWKDWESALNG